MAQKIVGIIKINGWVKRLTEVLAVCIIVGVCLVGNQIGEQQKEIVISDNTENERYDLGDMDGNGQTEYIEVVNVIKSIGPGYLCLYFNGEPIYEYDDPLRIYDIEDAEYIDLDHDGEAEIFFSFLPSVNSAPLTEYVVLKQVGNNWKALEMIHGEDMLDNAFPISCYRGKEENTVVIACEGLEEQIVLTAYNENSEGGSEEKSDTGLLGDYKEGDACGKVWAWGIWEIHSGSYEGRSCLIAMHGLERFSEEWGSIDEVYIHFDYNEEGYVNILDMKFRPWDSQDFIGTTEANSKCFQ